MNIDNFISALAVRTRSEETIRAYRQDLERFQVFLQSRNLRVTQVKSKTITEYVAYLEQNAGRTRTGTLAAASITRRLAVLSRYFEFLRAESNGKIRNPFRDFKGPKVDNNLPRAVDEGHLQTLIDGITDPRDKAILLLFLYSGLRLSELYQLNVDTIRVHRRQLPTGQTITIGEGEVLGKGSKRRRFVIAIEALTALAAYLQVRPAVADQALFLSERGARLSCRAIQQRLQEWCKRLNLAHIHIHQMRHCYATRMVNAGMSLAVLRELMGHSSSCTQRYFRIRPERMSREYHAAMEFVRAQQ